MRIIPRFDDDSYPIATRGGPIVPGTPTGGEGYPATIPTSTEGIAPGSVVTRGTPADLPTETAVLRPRILTTYVPSVAAVVGTPSGGGAGTDDGGAGQAPTPQAPVAFPAANVPTPAPGTVTDDSALNKLMDLFSGSFGSGATTGGGGSGGVTVTPVPVDTGAGMRGELSNTVKGALVLAALAGLGYLGWRYYQKRRAAAA